MCSHRRQQRTSAVCGIIQTVAVSCLHYFSIPSHSGYALALYQGPACIVFPYSCSVLKQMSRQVVNSLRNKEHAVFLMNY